MKPKLLLSLLLSFYFYLLSSQIPQGFTYQAIARDIAGNPIVNTPLPVRITIQSDSIGGTAFWIEEHPSVTTNSLGLFTLILGKGERKSESTVLHFNNIDWNTTPKFIKTEINYSGWKDMGSSRLWSVPYSMVAGNLNDTLQKLIVKGETSDMEEALFEVKNKNGKTVFAVYNEGVRIYVNPGAKSSTKGGFAIGGFDQVKGTQQNYFVVNSDSIRAYVDNGTGKSSTKGGFAIGGFETAKGQGQAEYLRVTSDSVKVSKSLLIPRLTTNERDNLPFTPGDALIIFNTTEGCMQIFKNNVWSNIWCFNCAPAFIIQPVDKTICSGENANFFISATGTSLSYQWQESSDNGSSWHNIYNGGTAPVYSGCNNYSLSVTTIPVSHHNYKYRCVVSGSCLPNVTSNAVTLNVGANPPVITSQPANQVLSKGCAASFSVASPGYAVTYKWQQSTDGGSTWTNISNGGSSPVFGGATTPTLSLANVPWAYNNYKFRSIISNLCGTDATSSAATLTISPVSILTHPTNQSLTTGCTASFTIITPAGYTILYQWQTSSDGGNIWNSITNGGTSPVYSGVTTATLSLSNVPLAYNNYRYRCLVSSLCGPNETSSGATLTIAASSILTQPTNQQLTTGCAANFSITTPSGYLIAYQWQESTDGGSAWSNISNGGTSPVFSGVTSATLSLSNVPYAYNNNQYRCIVGSLCGPNETSTAATLTTNGPPLITAQPINKLIYAGYNTSFNITVLGSGYNYQWQESTNGGGTWSNVTNGGSNPAYSGANTTSLSLLNIPLANNNYQYRCVVSQLCRPDAISDAATLSVPNNDPVTDIDGNTYNTIGIDNKLWMAENLKTTKYNNGLEIPLITNQTTWSGLLTPGYCWYNNDEALYKNVYGALYNWYAVATGNLCPIGWHVPSDEEWTTLVNYFGGTNIAGGPLKETGTVHWQSPNSDATNESGFTGLPGGFRYEDGQFREIGKFGEFWTSTENSTIGSFRRELAGSNPNANRGIFLKTDGFSVRCVKDAVK